MDSKEAMQRWPRLTAHLVCESLGYFTPTGAANAITSYKAEEPFACEWYSHMAQFRGGMFDHDSLIAVGRETLAKAFAKRRYHSGYMAEYQQAIALVRESLATGREPVFASWF